MNKVTGERVFASESQVRSQTQVLQTQLQEEIDKAKALSEELTNELNNAKNVNKELMKSSESIVAKYREEIESHEKDIEEMHKLIELQKIYCYLIPRLMTSSGLEIPEDFDITDFSHAEKLYKRFRTGDLMDF